MNRFQKEVLYIIILFLFSILSIVVVSELNGKADLTDGRIFTIKEPTTQWVNSFDQPIYINWWKSKNLESSEVEIMTSLLKQMKEASSHNISVEIQTVDLRKKSDLEQIGIIEYTIGSQQVISGIEVSYLGNTEIIPLVTDSQKLELQIAEALFRLENSGKADLVIFPDSSAEKPTGSYSSLITGLNQYFNVHIITNENPLTFIPEVMIVPDRKDFSMEELFAIDRTIQMGSTVIILSDGLKIDPDNNDFAVQDEKSIISIWMEKYGLEIGNAIISDRNSLSVLPEYSMWFKAEDNLNLLWASPLQLREKDGLEYTVIGKTSQYSWLNEGDVDLRPDKYSESPYNTGPYTFAVTINGRFNPLFETTEKSVNGGNLTLIGSSLSFSDYMQSSGSYKNINYMRNLIYHLLGEENLYEIGKESYHEYLLNKAAIVSGKAQRIVNLINFIIAPVILLLIYVFFLIKRNKKRYGR